MRRSGSMSSFRRTIQRGRKPVRLEFAPGQPIEVSDREVAQLAADVGRAIVPVAIEQRPGGDRPKVLRDAPPAADPPTDEAQHETP